MLKAANPSAAVKTYNRAGHFPYMNRPAEYTEALDGFLS